MHQIKYIFELIAVLKKLMNVHQIHVIMLLVLITVQMVSIFTDVIVNQDSPVNSVMHKLMNVYQTHV